MNNEMKRMSKNDKQQALVPRLRFPEFLRVGDWTNIPLGQVLTVRDFRQAPSEEVPLYSLTIENGVTPKSDRYNREFLVQNAKKKYKVVQPGDIVYNPANLRWGAIDISKQDHSVVVSPIYEVLYVTDPSLHVPRYVSYAITRPAQIKLFAEKGQGTLIERIAVKIDDFLETPLPLPSSPAEQQKIADCLGSLDDLIAAEGRKLAALRDHKKGLMQQLFPREGETRPRLRFPEFRDAGEWVEKTISSLGEVITGSTPSTTRPEYYGGDRQFVSPADISAMRFITETKTTLTELGFQQTRPIKAKSVLFVCIGSTIGKVAQNLKDCATNQQINSVNAGPETSSDFLYYLLSECSERVAEIAGNQAVPIINKSLFSRFKVLCPKKGEQQRIADCLSSLDALIAAQAEKLDALRTHKRGLMQQLFPSPESVSP